ncbi:ras association domain-containing protein 1 homolog isoform X3 [Amphibalanus amphitrite]|uniref:ras association domain-containing protein 1 homolog isoform X3 n=1 Tax=Amphibalanus amphitrite TaxID=1232801 RepID=UPI001C926FB7|nr:ras association domain-containing protein 1 homolog isoform X3 [Amphibalanus amphitrite]XP_043222221.1 ras association domain-containing protein 1 homolog isoform X3 [Amphibalanus amphitrite]
MSSGPRTPSPGGGRAGGSQSELPDWDRLRLSLHNAIGELLHSWGLLAAFRRRHAGRPAAARSPGAAPSPPHRRREHIEMASFSYRFDGTGTGEGHRFTAATLDQPSWCDCCGDLLWSDTVICRYCSYTCHQRCRDLVTLDCPSDTASDLDLSEVTDPNQDVDLVEVQTLVRCDNVAVAEVRETDSTIKAEMIEKYNATSHGLYMTLSEDGRSFHGFIRVHMNLFRPINIVAGTRPPSIYDVLQPEQTLERTLASFYLPRDTVKALHIDNDTTVHEVISSLLKKFKIVDDPRKFALYERLTEQGESTKVKMRRLADSERPLELALSWSHHGVVNKKFVLQENDTGDILWDNFTLPELNNFLTMLNKEEEDYKRRVRQKYTEMKRRIAEQMDQLRPGGAHSEPAPAAAATAE